MEDIDNITKYLHNQSKNNKTLLAVHKYATCFQCMKVYEHNKIIEYTDDGTTAICPNCGVDAVLPGWIVQGALITLMNIYFISEK
jgi:NAD-dependent SIR2 family protein deacetylase